MAWLRGASVVCVLALWRDEVLWPVLWRFADEHASDHTLGQSIVGAAEEILGALTEALAG